jgi:acetyltransferase-like isoleucine patch superfamily enzyme
MTGRLDAPPPRSALRRFAGRLAWLGFLGPLQRNGLALQRRWYRLLRLRFLLQCRLTAAWSHASIEVTVDRTARIARGVRVELGRSTHNVLTVGARTKVARDAHFSLSNGSVLIGAGCLIRPAATFHVRGVARIGEEVLVSTGVIVHCEDTVDVGAHSVLSEYTTVADSRHLRTAPGVPIYHTTRSAPVRIGANVWVASHCVITSGVNIGDQAIIGGGAVVTKDVPAWWLAAGNPARPVKELTVEESVATRTAMTSA